MYSVLRLYVSLLTLLGPLVVCGLAHGQQNPHGQLPVTTLDHPYLFLIKDPVVHQELGLDPQQRKALSELNDELDAVLWSTRNQPPQRSEKLVREATQTARQRLAAALSQDQLTRLRQIEMWTLGMKAFLRDDLSQPLQLTDNQRTKIRETLTKTQESIRELSAELQSGGSRDALQRKARALKVDEQKQIVATLTRRQQQQWIELLGKKIDVSQLGRLRFKAPDFDGQDGWLNSTPLTLRQLKGKVVALHFYAFA
jgi:hypothetical protein